MTQNIALLTLPVVLITDATACRFISPVGAQAGADANALGVTRSDGLTGEAVSVDVIGTAIVEAGDVLALGDTVKSDALGRAIPWITSGARVGIALQAATDVGQLIEVLLIPNAA